MTVLLEVWLHLVLWLGLPVALVSLALMGLDIVKEVRR